MTTVPLTRACDQVGKPDNFVVRSTYVYSYMFFIQNGKQALYIITKIFHLLQSIILVYQNHIVFVS